MGLIRSALRGYQPSSLATPERWLIDGVGGGETAAGVFVTEETALYYSAFFAGVNVIASDVGSLPLPLYERVDRGKQRATDHALYRVLHDEPNPLMSPMAFRRTIQGHALTWGDGYSYIVRDGTGQVTAVWPLHPGRVGVWPVSIGRGRFDLTYTYSDPERGISARMLPDEVLHISGLGSDGIRGYSVVQMARQAIGLGLATEAYGAKFFGNGSRPGGVLKTAGKLSTQGKDRLRDDWQNLHRGIDAAQRVAVLEEGLEWQAIGVPNNDAQFLETRKLQVTELARWLRLPPHKIGDLERSTFSNIESQQLDYVTSALRSWLVTWEQAISLRLLTPTERRTYFAEHVLDALLRGDTGARFTAYATARQWGWMSANDVREKENLNPVPGGDAYLQPLNMVPAGETPAAAGAQAEQATAAVAAARMMRGRGLEARRRIAAQFRPLIVDADTRIAKLERAEVASLVRRHLERARSTETFMAAAAALYGGLITDRATKAWMPLFAAFATDIATDAAADVGHDDEIDLSRWVEAYVTSHITYRMASALGQLGAVIGRAEDAGDDPAEKVNGRLDHWVDTRPERTATWESNQMANAAAREAWIAAGVRKLVWNADGDTCPFCLKLDGTVVGIQEAFATAGGEITGPEAALAIDRDMFHPPIHPGCDCKVLPA